MAYSDGLSEALNPADEEYGTERLAAFLVGTPEGSTEQVRDAVLADVAAFAAGVPQHDDVTLVIVRRVAG